jgi:TRAP-type C4-dicarboxylate transport system permease small subunit
MNSDELSTCLYIAMAFAATLALFYIVQAHFDARELRKMREEADEAAENKRVKTIMEQQKPHER